MRRTAALVLLATVAACGSSPAAQFFTLDAVRPVSASAGNTGVPLKLVAVHIPALLDRQEMVREGAGGTLSVNDEHRWGAPFDDMVRRVLTQDLAARLPKDMVVFPEQPAPDSTNALVVDILEFQGDTFGAVTFDGSWSILRKGSDNAVVSHQVHLRDAGTGSSYKGEVAAMSRILGLLADQIAAGGSAVPRQ